MCRSITCNTCGRPTWAGCGNHVEQVLGHIPHDERCDCEADAARGAPGLVARLFGR